MQPAQLLELAQLLEQYVSLGICLVAAALGAFSYRAWHRERDPRMRTVAVGYGMFALYGLVVFLEYLLVPYLPYATLELLEHASALLVLGGLLTFFVALTRR